MDQIPSTFWMIIISVITFGFTAVLIYFALLIKESMKTVREMRFLLIETHEIMDSAKIILEKVGRVVDTVGSTTETISTMLLKPFAFVTTAIQSVKSFASGFVRDEE